MSATTTIEQERQQQPLVAENILRLFPEITATQSARDDSQLDGYDEEQIRLMDEVCIALDHDDNPIGSVSKKISNSLINRLDQHALTAI